MMKNTFRKKLKGFANFVDCIEDCSEELFFIYDYKEGKCCIVKEKLSEEEQLKTLKVVNSDRKEISCFSIDNCFIKTGGNRCDCVVFDSSNIVFVEMKANTKTDNLQLIRQYYQKAALQILATKAFFDSKEISFAGVRKEAIICFPDSVLTGSSLTRNSSMVRSFQVDFLNQNRFPINLKNEIIF